MLEGNQERQGRPGAKARMSDPRPGKRSPVPLRLECGVCGAPAPEHRHFGGQPASYNPLIFDDFWSQKKME